MPQTISCAVALHSKQITTEISRSTLLRPVLRSRRKKRDLKNDIRSGRTLCGNAQYNSVQERAKAPARRQRFFACSLGGCSARGGKGVWPPAFGVFVPLKRWKEKIRPQEFFVRSQLQISREQRATRGGRSAPASEARDLKSSSTGGKTDSIPGISIDDDERSKNGDKRTVRGRAEGVSAVYDLVDSPVSLPGRGRRVKKGEVAVTEWARRTGQSSSTGLHAGKRHLH